MFRLRTNSFLLSMIIGLFLAASLSAAPGFSPDDKKDNTKKVEQKKTQKDGDKKDSDKKDKEDKPVYQFTMVKEVKHTPIRNQYRTGTCWSFATLSFLEAEAIRAGAEETDLSEMFVVRHTYPIKAMNYIRMHGRANFGSGGQSHDAIDRIKEFGIVPEQAYTGQQIGERRHNHGEMASVIKAMLESVLKRRGKRVTPRWFEAFNAILNIYMGTPPKTFKYKGKEYTPKSFAKKYLPINPDDYMEITSYSHHPFYKTFRLEIPDNWTYNDDYLNVPVNDLTKIADHALKNGYTLVWDGDVSETTFFARDNTFAIIPDQPEWEDLKRSEVKEKIKSPVKEKTITQELRQKTFDNMTTTDDHLMHIVGIAKDQKGNEFYLVKNSWGTKRGKKGYLYMSKPYFLLKTTVITINKKALPKDIKKKIKR